MVHRGIPGELYRRRLPALGHLGRRQWSGDPTDIELSENEREGQRKVTRGKRQTVTYWTIGTKDGSYTRSYQEVREDETMHVLGIHYTTQQAYNKYKKQYLQFNASLKQFAD